MDGNLTESGSELDRTDELPVLTEESILKFQLRAVGPERADTQSLESSVETLRRTLEEAEERWRTLEARLERQDLAIAALNNSESSAAGASSIAQHSLAREHRSLLEYISSLETYIAGRADRWQAMEQDLAAKAQRIAELESELAQRIERERNLEDRLHDQGDRNEALRARLERMNLQLEKAEAIGGSGHLDATREIFAAGFGQEEIPTLEASDSIDDSVPGEPALICLLPGGSKPFPLDKELITIGRAPDCDIQLTTDVVSRQHATIRRERARTVIEDRSSTNGVFVNAKRIDRKTLAHGDEIAIGESRFRFECGVAPR